MGRGIPLPARAGRRDHRRHAIPPLALAVAALAAAQRDPATPGASGSCATSATPRLLTFRGDGHGVLKQFDPCAVSASVDYVVDRELPPAGASCTQAPGPWDAASNAGRPRLAPSSSN